MYATGVSWWPATIAPSSYGATAAPSSYGAAVAPCSHDAAVTPRSYDTAPPSSYGTIAPQASYGATIAPRFYGADTPSFYGAAVAQGSYGATVTLSSYIATIHQGSYDAIPNIYGATTPSSYDSAVTQGSYDTAVTHGAYGATVTPSVYGASITPSVYNAAVTPSSFKYGLPSTVPPERMNAWDQNTIKEDMQKIIDDIRFHQRSRQMRADMQEIIDDINTRQWKRRVAANIQRLDDLMRTCIEDEEQESLTSNTLLEIPIAVNTISQLSEELLLAPIFLDDSDKLCNMVFPLVDIFNNFKGYVTHDIPILDESQYGAQHSAKFLGAPRRNIEDPFYAQKYTSPATFFGFDPGGCTISARFRHVTALVEVRDADIILIKHIIWIFDSGGITFYWRGIVHKIMLQQWRNPTTMSSFDGQGRNVRVSYGDDIFVIRCYKRD